MFHTTHVPIGKQPLYHICIFRAAAAPFFNCRTALLRKRNFNGRLQGNHARYKNLIALKGCVFETITALLCEHVRQSPPGTFLSFAVFIPSVCVPFAVFLLMYRRRRLSSLTLFFFFWILKFDAVSVCAHAN